MILKVAQGSSDQFSSPPSLLVYLMLVMTSSTAFGARGAAARSAPDGASAPVALLVASVALASVALLDASVADSG